MNHVYRLEVIAEISKVVDDRKATQVRKTVDIEEIRFLEIYRKLSAHHRHHVLLDMRERAKKKTKR